MSCKYVKLDNLNDNKFLWGYDSSSKIVKVDLYSGASAALLVSSLDASSMAAGG